MLCYATLTTCLTSALWLAGTTPDLGLLHGCMATTVSDGLGQ